MFIIAVFNSIILTLGYYYVFLFMNGILFEYFEVQQNNKTLTLFYIMPVAPVIYLLVNGYFNVRL